jgi:hypothetical protein
MKLWTVKIFPIKIVTFYQGEIVVEHQNLNEEV